MNFNEEIARFVNSPQTILGMELGAKMLGVAVLLYLMLSPAPFKKGKE